MTQDAPIKTQFPSFYATSRYGFGLVFEHGRLLIILNIIGIFISFAPVACYITSALSNVQSSVDRYFAADSAGSDSVLAAALMAADTKVQLAIFSLFLFVVSLHLLAALSYIQLENKALMRGESWQKVLLKFWHLRPFRYSLMVLVVFLIAIPSVFLFPPSALLLGVWPIHLPLYFSSQPRASIRHTLRHVLTLKFADTENTGRFSALISIAALSMVCMLLYSLVIFLVESLESQALFLRMQDSLKTGTGSFYGISLNANALGVGLVFGIGVGCSLTLLASLFVTFWNGWIGSLKIHAEVDYD